MSRHGSNKAQIDRELGRSYNCVKHELKGTVCLCFVRTLTSSGCAALINRYLCYCRRHRSHPCNHTGQKSSKKYVAFEKAGEPFTAPIAGTPAVGASMLSKLTTYLLLLARVFS
jgi:hypothetical protein